MFEELLNSYNEKILFEDIDLQSNRSKYSNLIFDIPNNTAPIIKDIVREKIKTDISLINDHIDITNYFVKGSALTPNYDNNSTIDIYVGINNIFNIESIYENIKGVWKTINNTKLKNIPYTFKYHIADQMYKFNDNSSIYDIKNNRWIKRIPSKTIPSSKYISILFKKIDNINDLSDDIKIPQKDFEVLKDLSISNLNEIYSDINIKINEITSHIDNIIDTKKFNKFKHSLWGLSMSPSNIKQYGIRNKLPLSLIILFIKRYYYYVLRNKITNALEYDTESFTVDPKGLNILLHNELKTESTRFKQLYNGSIKGRGDMQHKVKHRQQSNNAGLLGHSTRKSLNLLPDYQRKDPNKLNNKINSAKKNNIVLHVKKGTPEAEQLIRKYRISDPTGKKVIGSNQYNNGVTIIFED